MSQSSTIDNQKVFKSATQKFTSFLGAVENVSHTKHMEDIYTNMGRLFDAFTKGALTGQGANSEWILRTIHKSLDEKFLKIVQDNAAVDKIVDEIRKNQDSATPDSEMVSDTTKQVVLNKLTPDNCNPQQVMLDFIAELQNDILKVKLNLNREYERQKLLWAKSAEGQKQDLDRLNAEFKEQNQGLLDTLGQIGNQDGQWNEEQMAELERLQETFAALDGGEGQLSQFMESEILGNKTLKAIQDTNPQLKTTTLVKEIQGVKPQSIGDEKEERKPEKSDAPVEQGQGGDKEQQEIDTKELEKAQKQLEEIQKQQGKEKIQVPKAEQQGSKLNVSPSQNGMCTCPICGHVHPKNGRHVGQEGGGELTQAGVETTLGKIHENIQRQLNNKKFKNAFMMDYSGAQRGLSKHMKKIDKAEEEISSSLGKTKWQIRMMKLKSKAKGILGMMLGGIASFAFIAVGALILITLARMALKKWKDTYMPKPDGSKLTIFGISIPGWDTIKALGTGIKNFITVGLPNHFNRLQKFFGKMKKSLFGKGGILEDMAATKNALRRIIAAWIIGQTKKVGGAVLSIVLQIIGWAFCWVPGVQPVCNFLAKFGPLIYSFVTTQVMKLWSDGKADAERGAAADIASQQSATKGMIAHFRVALKGAAANVKTFSGQQLAIPGLETSNGKGGELPKRAAIMRHMPTIYGKNAKRAAKMQNKAVDEAQEARKDQQELAKSALISAKKGTVMGDLSRNWSMSDANNGQYYMEQWGKDAELRRKYGGDIYRYRMAIRRKVVQNMLAGNAISGQMKALDAYIDQLVQSPRFKGVKGPLYHPETGWNPGYRVFASDLMSPIPLEPFEAIHDKADVPFGTPVEAETGSVGFMPFTWMQNNARISVNPVGYEIERAKALKKLYKWVAEQAADTMFNTAWFGSESTAMADFNKVIQKKGGKLWLQWNNAMAKHQLFDYENRSKVVYGDKFSKFINDFRNNRMSDEDNDLDVLVGNKKKAWTAGEKAALAGAVVGGVMGGAVGAYVGSAAASAAANYTSKTIGNLARTQSYDKAPLPKPTPKVKNGGFWGGVFNLAAGAVDLYKAGKRKLDVHKRMNMWRDKTFLGVKYGDIRDLMFNAGLFELLSRGTIMNTVGSVTPILEWMVERHMLPGATGLLGGAQNALSNFMANYFQFAGIKGYNWDNFKNNKKALAGFAQSFLEYFKFKFLPVWNTVEELLSKDITQQSDESAKNLVAGLKKLHEAILPGTIFGFMREHLRFPTMTVKLIDYSNATKREKQRIDWFKFKLGIPNAKMKETILGEWQASWGKIGEMSNADLLKNLDKIQAQLQKAEFEARYTGDYAYFKQLKQYWKKYEDERSRRVAAQLSGSKVVKKAADLKTEVVEPPPKSLAEIEEEKRKREAEEEKRRAEQEKKEKEERERKLKEEAKRKEELAIANAKIKAMEAIRKQEENYEAILQKLIGDPGKVTDAELKSLGKEVANIKQEAENQIAKLPREEREMKLALIRGDKISEKTFTELKETAVGLHGNLQEYVGEVNKIPVGSVMAIQNSPSAPPSQPVKLQDSDSVDLGD